MPIRRLTQSLTRSLGAASRARDAAGTSEGKPLLAPASPPGRVRRALSMPPRASLRDRLAQLVGSPSAPKTEGTRLRALAQRRESVGDSTLSRRDARTGSMERTAERTAPRRDSRVGNASLARGGNAPLAQGGNAPLAQGGELAEFQRDIAALEQNVLRSMEGVRDMPREQADIDRSYEVRQRGGQEGRDFAVRLLEGQQNPQAARRAHVDQIATSTDSTRDYFKQMGSMVRIDPLGVRAANRQLVVVDSCAGALDRVEALAARALAGETLTPHETATLKFSLQQSKERLAVAQSHVSVGLARSMDAKAEAGFVYKDRIARGYEALATQVGHEQMRCADLMAQLNITPTGGRTARVEAHSEDAQQALACAARLEASGVLPEQVGRDLRETMAARVGVLAGDASMTPDAHLEALAQDLDMPYPNSAQVSRRARWRALRGLRVQWREAARSGRPPALPLSHKTLTQGEMLDAYMRHVVNTEGTGRLDWKMMRAFAREDVAASRAGRVGSTTREVSVRARGRPWVFTRRAGSDLDAGLRFAHAGVREPSGRLVQGRHAPNLAISTLTDPQSGKDFAAARCGFIHAEGMTAATLARMTPQELRARVDSLLTDRGEASPMVAEALVMRFQRGSAGTRREIADILRSSAVRAQAEEVASAALALRPENAARALEGRVVALPIFAQALVHADSGARAQATAQRNALEDLTPDAGEVLNLQLPQGVARVRPQVMQATYRIGSDGVMRASPRDPALLALLGRPRDRFIGGLAGEALGVRRLDAPTQARVRQLAQEARALWRGDPGAPSNRAGLPARVAALAALLGQVPLTTSADGLNDAVRVEAEASAHFARSATAGEAADHDRVRSELLRAVIAE